MSTRRLQTAIGRSLLYVLLTLLALVFIFPFYWLFISSFKTQAQIFVVPPRWLPHPLTGQNFVDLYRETDLPRAFLNSVIISGGHVLLALFLCSLAGYAFAKYPHAPGHGRLFAFVLGTMMIPAQ